LILSLFFALLLMACSTPDTAAPNNQTNTGDEPVENSASAATGVSPEENFSGVQDLPTQGPNEFLRVAGSGPGESGYFTIENNQTIQVNWEQTSTGDFNLLIRNVTPDLSGDEVAQYNIRANIGPGEGSSGLTLPAGDYIIFIAESDGPWEVWLETSELVYENEAADDEFLHISDNAPGTSPIFTIAEDAEVLIQWEHDSIDDIRVVLVWLEASQPGLARQSLFQFNATTNGSMPVLLLAGEYQIEVQSVSSEFEIIVAPSQ
jgi:hypothetical protein